MTFNKDKTILFVMPRLPFPTISGRKTSLYHYCRIISEDLGYRLVVAAFLEKNDDPELKPQFIDKLVILKEPSKIEKFKNIVLKSFINSTYPIQVSLYLSNSAKKQVDMLIEKEKPIVVIADMVRCTEYIKHVNIFKIADLDDRISLRYERQFHTDIDNVNPYGAFIETIPNIARKIILFKPLKIAILKREIKLLKNYEISIGEMCDRTVFVAQKETDYFNSEIQKNKAVAVPIGVDVEYFAPIVEKDKKNIITFLGAMNVAHNENAVKHFIEDIFPGILERVPNAKFCVIGGGVSKELKSMESEYIEFTGRVDDVRKYLSKSKVFVCSMQFGSGIKTKNLEAMAMGLPIVTTSIGAENINAINGKDWFVEDTDYKFIQKVVELLTNEDIEKKCSIEARNFILNNFTWEVARKKLKRILDEAI